MDSNTAYRGVWRRRVFSGPRLRMIHVRLFHGRDAFPNADINTFHTVVNAEAVVDHAIPYLPSVFAPRLNWIISAEVKSRLSHLDCIRWNPVSFRHVFWMDIEQTSLDWHRTHFGRSEDIIFELPESPDRDKYITMPYYEMIAVSAWDVAPECREMDPAIVLLSHDRKKADLPARVNDLLRFPVFTSDGLTYLRKPLFESIEPFIDTRFFCSCDIDLGQFL